MKKVLILLKKKDALNKPTASKLLSDYLKGSAEVTRDYLGYVNYSFDYEKGEWVGKIRDKKLEDFDLIYFRTVGLMKDRAFLVANYCKKKNIKMISDNFLATNSNSKLIQLFSFFDGGVSAPKSYYSAEWKPQLNKKAFPLVMKNILGKGGDAVHLVKNSKDVKDVLKESKESDYIFQEYIPNEYDWRIVVVGGKAVYSCKRVRNESEEFRNNVKLGAEEVVVKAPKEINKLAVLAAKSCKLSVAGVDIIEGKEDNYVIEVNRSPSFTKDFEISNEIPELGEYIKRCLNQK